MDRTVLILGPTGRFGRHVASAFAAADWEVRRFDRKTDNLWDAAWGASVIVHGWHPAYPDWATDMPALSAQVIEVAKASGATVILPCNVYTFGEGMPRVLDADTPDAPSNIYGQMKLDMERAFRDAGVRTIALRAGDFIDTQDSGNWFDMVITKPLAKGSISYPGPVDVDHAWAYLPDVAKAAVMLAERRQTLATFEDIPFAGYPMTGRELARVLSDVTGRAVTAKPMSWLPILLARPFWNLAKPLLAMRYLWRVPHGLDDAKLMQLIPEFRPTDMHEAMRSAVQSHVHPHQSVPTRRESVRP